jgi:hypothetical protein
VTESRPRHLAAERDVLLVAIRVGLGLVQNERSDHSPSFVDRASLPRRFRSALAWNHLSVSILWIILIIVLVLLLLGFFSRGRW